jgi:DNA-binding NarL/FixJ family response regulator
LSSSISQSSLVAAAEQLLSAYSPKPSTTSIEVAQSAMTPDSTTFISKNKRPSKIQLAALLRKIRHLLAEGYTNKEIIEMMQLEERTFYRYMARIYEQDKAYF